MKSPLKIITTILAIMGFSLGTAVYLAQQIGEPYPTSPTAYLKTGNAPIMSDPGWYDLVSKFDFVAFTPGVWEHRQQHRDSLMVRNADIMIGEYWNIHTISFWMKDAWERNPTSTQGARLWGALHDHMAVTTEGDTASIWKSQPLFDLFDPEVRALAVRVAADNARASNLDWLMLDYFTVPLSRYDMKPPTVIGELDFDRDGVGHDDDSDEQAELRRVWSVYVEELRAAMPGVLLIPNGRLALRDDDFAGQLDGAWVENFPNWFFPDLAAATDTTFAYSLHYLTADRWDRSPGIVFLGTPTYRDWSPIADQFDGCGTGYTQMGVVLPPELD